MADGMGSAWVAPRKKKSELEGNIALIRVLTDVLAREHPNEEDANDHTDLYSISSYYDALDDLRALVNLPPTDRSTRA